MKLNNLIDLGHAIRSALSEKCAARCLDDEDDFEAVMQVIGGAIEEWFDGRCEGCK